MASAAIQSAVATVDVPSNAQEPVTWLWRRWLAVGRLNVVVGPAGIGTLFGIDVEARVSTGRDWPDHSTNSAVWHGSSSGWHRLRLIDDDHVVDVVARGL